MAVLVEAISVIVRRWDVTHRFPGGLRAFRALSTNHTFCTDGRLVRVGFGSPDEAVAFVQQLQDVGFVGVAEGRAIDSCLVDQIKGMVYRAEWLEVYTFPYRGGGLTLASLAGDTSSKVACPAGWVFETSLSARIVAREPRGPRLRHSA